VGQFSMHIWGVTGSELDAIQQKMILDLDKEGAFIPICTRRAFQGYFNESKGYSEKSFFWGADEKVGYFGELTNRLGSYLPSTPIKEEGESL
jgi:hypothetical protein